MDPVSLAWVAATTIVTLLATDAWGTAKTEIGALWRRFRPEQADAVESELAATREEISATAGAAEVAERDALTRAWALHWESRLLRLLNADNAVAAELARVTKTLADGMAGSNGERHVIQRATASGGSVIIQVGGDARLGALPLVSPGPSSRYVCSADPPDHVGGKREADL